MMAERTALYRIWGTADLLLYIGVSKDFGTRWKQHAKTQPWWPEMQRLTVDCWYDSRPEAEAEETAAINLLSVRRRMVACNRL
jgi:predicted GIY-YIG superfamily endonuclease